MRPRRGGRREGQRASSELGTATEGRVKVKPEGGKVGNRKHTHTHATKNTGR